MKALIAADDPTLAGVLVPHLESRDFEVEVKADALGAWTTYRRQPAQLVLVDEQSLGREPCRSLCGRIRAQATGDQTVLVAIARSGNDFGPLLAIGVDDFLTRPLDEQLLAARLDIAFREAMARSSRRRRETALQRSESTLSAVVANAAVTIIGLDGDAIVRHVKGRGLEPFGLTPAESIGQSIYTLFGGTDDLRRGIEQALEGAASTSVVALEGGRLEVRWSPQLSGSQVVGVLGVVVALAGPATAGPALDVPPVRSFHGIVGTTPAMHVVFEQIRDVAEVDWTVLIQGETGTGKELVARAIHDAGPRANKAFIAVNCAGLTESLLQSQLFGHRRGAFTGAVKDQDGLFEAASGGTLFLDEIGDISQAVQVSLLRVLETREITRVGETQPRLVDTRVITATHRDLAAAVAEASFRADLYYRIRVARIQLPPLRSRVGDIPALVEVFLERTRRQTNKEIVGVDDEVMDALRAYSWPGNVRELKTAIEFAVLRCRGSHLGVESLTPEIREGAAAAPARASDTTRNFRNMSESEQRRKVLEALDQAGGSRTDAAKILGVSRATFYRYLSRWDLDG